MLTMSLPIENRKGSLKDVSKLKFAEGLSVSGESVEFNVIGMGHEYWVAVQADTVVAIIVLGKASQCELRIMHLEVSPARKNEGVGSALIQAVIQNYPDCTLSVVPFEGTEDFYSRLGFLKVSRWEMCRQPAFISIN
jgi:N-acetylglutamate synthase-like GNAT family acetyltransferase